MRIYGNRRLKTVPGETTRPTSARVREAIFNIWQGKIEGCRWLDLCAGNGSMGAEALCRDAASAVAIERWSRACGVIRHNWRSVARDEQQWQVICGDVRTSIPSDRVFDRIYFDPPYKSNLYQPVLELIDRLGILASEGEIAVEHNRKLWQAQNVGSLTICREKTYGSTAVTFYCYKGGSTR